MPLDTVPFDAAAYLTDPQDQAELLTEAIASGDGNTIRKAVGIVARARGAGRLVTGAHEARAADDEIPLADGDPTLSTVLSLLDALGVKLSATLDSGTPRAHVHSG